MNRVRWLPVALSMLLAACVATPVRHALPVASEAAVAVQARRVAVLATHPQWALQGRIALSDGRNGGSGRIDWRQDGARFAVALSAPVTRQSWRLGGGPGHARLEGLDGGPREGTDPQGLLLEATGWTIPVAALASWVRGTADASLPAASLQYAADGELARLQQGGWVIDYTGWQAQPALGIALPHRINATLGMAGTGPRVRLVIDAWQEGLPAQ